MGDKIIMRKKELERKSLLEGVRYKKITLQDAATRMQLSYRQAKRVWKRYQQDPILGLLHKNRGKKPKNCYPDEFKAKILELYRCYYLGFGPTFAAEKLEEDNGIKINEETLRIWLKQEGLWTRKRKHKVYRERRARRESFGDLLQIDGSIHAWFVGDEDKYCLLNMVDDATGISFALLGKGETTQILLTVFRKWIERYGIPKSVYVDLKNVYVSSKYLKEKYDDDLLIKDSFSVFEQVCEKLNVTIIKAYSAQAKGRVERKHGVYQDRLVKDLKLYGIKDIAGANQYLEERFLNKINQKFAKSLDGIIDAHRECTPYGNLEEVFCWNYRRQLRNDWTIQFKREYYQINEEKELKPGAFITLRRYLDGGMKFWHGEKELSYYQRSRKPILPSKLKTYSVKKGPVDSSVRSQNAKKNKHKTPWSQSDWLFKKKGNKVHEVSK